MDGWVVGRYVSLHTLGMSAHKAMTEASMFVVIFLPDGIQVNASAPEVTLAGSSEVMFRGRPTHYASISSSPDSFSPEKRKEGKKKEEEKKGGRGCLQEAHGCDPWRAPFRSWGT